MSPEPAESNGPLDPGAEVVGRSTSRQKRRVDALDVEATVLHGFDMKKDESTLHAAYNDAQGVTERFNKNMLARINRELGGSFRLDSFQHVAFWNERMSRIEMHLESRVEQQVWVQALARCFHFSPGERIHTENSYKFTQDSIADLLERSGLRVEEQWTDTRGWFSEVMARV